MDGDDVPKQEEGTGEEEEAAPPSGGGGILLSGADEPEDEPDEEEEPAATAGIGTTAAPSAGAAAVFNTADHPYHLIPSIITPSPFAHHNSSDRYRSALSRVTSAPLTDVEAWGAILTEASTSYRSLVPHLHYLSAASLATGASPPPNIGTIAELESKLDWVESCHGALLKHFPYAASYVVSMAEILLGQTALPGEDGSIGAVPAGFPPPHEGMLTDRQRKCQEKLEKIFTVGLGVTDLDGTAEITAEAVGTAASAQGDDEDGGGIIDPFTQSSTKLLGGILSPSAELWLLYVRYVTRRSTRIANMQYPPDQISSKAELIRTRTTTAYETALSRGGAYCLNNHLVWGAYLSFVKNWESQATSTAADGTVTTDHALLQKRLSHLRRLYQRLVGHPMTGLDQYWAEYEQYEKNQGGTGAEQLAAALIAEHQPRYQHARSVYLERNRVCDLRNASTSLGVGRLACPPVEPPADGASSTAVAEGGVGAGAEDAPGAGGEGDKVAEYETALEEELTLLSRWTTRVSYERTNPERLTPGDLNSRVRAVFKEYVACFHRHPEVWDGWSAWELLHSSSSSSSDGGGSGAGKKLTGKIMRKRAAMADAVLGLGMENVPSCALLVIQRAGVLERYGGKASADGSSGEGGGGAAGGEAAIDLLSKYATDHPTTLSYVCLQRMVRKYKGVSAARAVFSRARRELKIRAEDCVEEMAGTGGDGAADDDGPAANVVTENEEGDKAGDSKVGGKKAGASAADTTGGASRRMVTTRFDPSVGSAFAAAEAGAEAGAGGGADNEDNSATAVKRGVITHHLYSSHADLERYLNSSPHVAARVYELGLRRHRTFLTVSSYVLAYANLLLELGDWSNLRGLLARSVGACEEDVAGAAGADGAAPGRDGDKTKSADAAERHASSAKAKRDASRPLWDAYLRIESLISAVSGGGDADSVRNIEARRRRALYGPSSSTSKSDGDQGEDVAGGAYQAIEGNQHSNLADTLTRTDGYDASSRIANGLGRLVDGLEVCGLIGGGLGSPGGNASLGAAVAIGSLPSDTTTAGASKIADNDLAGGVADAGLRRRISYVNRREAMGALASIAGGAIIGASGVGVVSAPGGAAGRARERLLQQQQAAVGQASAANAAATLAPGSPEWLRTLIALLPRIPPHKMGMRPPPHLIEIALASLKGGVLPPERPIDPVPTATIVPAPGVAGDTVPSDPRKRKRQESNGGGGDSSDEENGGGASGYGSQFRARQRTRMMGAQ